MNSDLENGLKIILGTSIRTKRATTFLNKLIAGANGKTNFIEIPSKTMNKIFGTHLYSERYIQPLIQAGYIEVDVRYIKGLKYKSYRITNQYLPENLQTALIIKEEDMKIRNIDLETFIEMEPGPQGFIQEFGEHTTAYPDIIEIGNSTREEHHTKIIKHNYKGIEIVDITITKSCLNRFKDALQDSMTSSEGMTLPFSETRLYEELEGIFDKYKIDYLLNKWRQKHKQN